MFLHSTFILVLPSDNPEWVVGAWGPTESGCSDRQLNHRMVISDHLWLRKAFSDLLATGRTQPLLCAPQPGRAPSPQNIALPRRNGSAKGSTRDQKLQGLYTTPPARGGAACTSAGDRIFPVTRYVGSCLANTEVRAEEEGHRWMLTKWLSVKKSPVITQMK